MIRLERHPRRQRSGPGAARQAFGKRALDLVLAGSALIALSPVMLAVAVAIRVTMGPPVLYRHVRPGYQGRPFALIKFRSMLPEHGPDGAVVPVNKRVTRLGRILRRLSLDELPELWNVIKGEMSLVGPRPLMMSYLPRYSPEQARRHEVRPGITGLAQVNGRHTLGWDDRFALDVWYVDHWSLRVDLAILAATIRVAFQGHDVPDPSVEDYEFRGPDPRGDWAVAADRDAGDGR
jgi:lipopolysaccharide/colanic/teichoic acid biosynthesis glycosyltransferase